MSRYPSATWKPIRDTSTARLTKDILCLHTAVTSATGCWNYFDRLDVKVYSHGVIGGIWGGDAGKNLDGVAWQMADTNYRAAANLDGNWRVISWETADNAARPIAAWTPRQCDTIVRIMVDAHRLDGIPLMLIPDSKPGRRGVAYHRLGCDPYRISGGEHWSSSYGKDCPTDVRIKQLPALIQRARDIVNGAPTPTPEDDVLTDAEHKAVIHTEKILAENNVAGKVNDLTDDMASVKATLADLTAAVKALTPTPPPAG